MLPGHALSPTPLPSAFLSPRGTPRVVESTYFNFTPVAFSGPDGNVSPKSVGPNGYRDTTLGLASQIWTGSYDGFNLVLTPQVGTPINVFSQVNLIWFDFCFDQSANPVIAYADTFKNVAFYWYDTTISAFRVTPLPFGTDPWPFCQLDDTRPAESSSSDVVICYTRGTHLYFLAQRDRFGTEYDLGAIPGLPSKMLVAAGMSTGGRFQFEFANILPNLSFAYGKFVGSPVFKAVQASRVGDIKPRIWPSKKNNTVQA